MVLCVSSASEDICVCVCVCACVLICVILYLSPPPRCLTAMVEFVGDDELVSAGK